ncbi:MAG TPA: hypothetical protein VG755_29185 [Nannocystaceae bacterium]|nr:hypothetical protein [Nannocystaceae bacterium]
MEGWSKFGGALASLLHCACVDSASDAGGTGSGTTTSDAMLAGARAP